MNAAEYKGTRVYRDGLSKALEVARHRLRDKDFQACAPGILQEIARLDAELSKHSISFVLFWAQPSWANWTFASIAQRTSMAPPVTFSVGFNSPTKSAPWTSEIPHYDSSRRALFGMPLACSSI
jgi:hypothetical protein